LYASLHKVDMPHDLLRRTTPTARLNAGGIVVDGLGANSGGNEKLSESTALSHHHRTPETRSNRGRHLEQGQARGRAISSNRGTYSSQGKRIGVCVHTWIPTAMKTRKSEPISSLRSAPMNLLVSADSVSPSGRFLDGDTAWVGGEFIVLRPTLQCREQDNVTQ
jgi:hypothetical protein